MRYVSRAEALGSMLPNGAAILNDMREQVIFLYKGSITIVRLIEIDSGCGSCVPMWVAQVTLEMEFGGMGELDEAIKEHNQGVTNE